MPKYRELIRTTEQVVRNARLVLKKTERVDSVDLLIEIAIKALRNQINQYCGLGDRVIDPARRRVLDGEQVPNEEKIFSIFETHTELIKRGKTLKPVEFGHKVFIAESARGLITQYRVLNGNPTDDAHVQSSLERHQETFGEAPNIYSADRGFFSQDNIQQCKDAGVGLVCIPQRGGKKGPAQKAYEKSAAFKDAQRFRAGIEGRISVLFRGRGMKRCLAEGRERFELLVGGEPCECRQRFRASSKRRPPVFCSCTITSKRFRAWGFPFGPSIRIRLFADLCVRPLSFSNPIVALM